MKKKNETKSNKVSETSEMTKSNNVSKSEKSDSPIKISKDEKKSNNIPILETKKSLDEPIIVCKDLTVTFGKNQVVSNVSFQIINS